MFYRGCSRQDRRPFANRGVRRPEFATWRSVKWLESSRGGRADRRSLRAEYAINAQRAVIASYTALFIARSRAALTLKAWTERAYEAATSSASRRAQNGRRDQGERQRRGSRVVNLALPPPQTIDRIVPHTPERRRLRLPEPGLPRE